MWKACSRCGQIHDENYKCTKNATKYDVDYSKYGTLEERRLRRTAAWTKKSKAVRSAAQYLCEVCRDKGVYNYEDIEVHHIIPIKDNKALYLDDDNLICLCREHHEQAESGRLEVDYLKALAQKRIEREKSKDFGL